MSLRGTFFVATLLLSGPLALRADTVYYPNFSSTSGLTFVGSTTTTTTGDGTVLRVVPASSGQAGAAYSTTPVTLGSGNSFSTQFQFRITDPGGIDPADGITFVLSAGSSGLGGAGGGIGYGGVNNSVAIEFDTYQNGEYGDPNDNHVGIDVDGNLDSAITATPYGQGSCDTRGGYIAGCMSNGDIWTALITYDGTDLTVALTDGNGVTQNLLDYGIDVGSYLGTNTAYVGFTGGTGSGFENEDILNWEFSNTSTLPPPPPPSTPEPGSLVLLGSGLSGVAALMRRRMRRS